MRGTAAVLVCLISLHYLSVIDAYSARFTSENGMPGRDHEDKHPRKSTDIKRSLPASPDTSLRQYPDYDYMHYGIPNIPGSQYRDADIDKDLVDTDTVDSDAGTSTNDVSKTLQRLLKSVLDAMRQVWGKFGVKPVGQSARADTKRKNARNGPSKKRAMECRRGEGSETANPDKGNINQLTYLTDMAKKALDLAYNVVDVIDVSKLSEETKRMKEAVMEMLKMAKDALGELIDNVVHGIESGADQSPSMRRTRSVGKRTNTRDALEAYLTSLKSQKRSMMRKSLQRSSKRNSSTRRSDMMTLLNLMTEMEECINKMPAKNTSRLGVKCIVLPLMKILASPKRAGANGLTMDADSNVRSNKIESPDNLRRLNFPWGNIFLIPICDGSPPRWDTATTGSTTTTTTPIYPDHIFNDPEFDNVTTTTTEPSTTTSTTTEPLPTWPDPADPPVYAESDKEVRDDSRYRSKYDNDF